MHDDVREVEVDGREFLLVGTAHISRESADLVREVIERERPDRVCVELDRQRYHALAEEQRWENLDLKQVIRERQLSALLAQVLLVSYQRKLGGALGVLPGTELLAATRTAEALGIPVALCDRDVRITLRRAWGGTSFWRKSQLLGTLAASVFVKTELSEEDLRRLRQQDVLSELMRELGEEMPTLKRVLIDERDAYLARKILDADGQRIVAVVGAGHLEGIERALRDRRSVDLAALEEVKPVSRAWKWVGWAIPVLILASLVAIAVTQGSQAAGENLGYWIVANGVPCFLGAVLALGHPVTIASAFFVAPVTSLTPVIGAGYVLAFLQAWLRPPMVREFETLFDDFAVAGRWWRNRMLKIFLVFLLTTLGSLIGTYVGGYEIVSNLF